jgi:hypothetical protein
MKVLAATVLHYGSEYLKYAIESVKNSVDEHLIVYTERPSFGFETNKQNPDTKGKLKAITEQFPHVVWRDIHGVIQENVHRRMFFDYAEKHGYDIILVVDYDEVWIPEKVDEAIKHAYDSKFGNFPVMGSQWVTLWKSFNECVTDGFAPVRLFNMHNDLTKAEHINKGFIYHMGYCISDELMQYKISCHGHRADFDRNNKWFQDKWLGYKSGETKFLHPATQAYWDQARPFDKTKLPDVLKKHEKY